MEFFKNLWQWVVDNSSVIAGILTPANLALLIGAVVSFVRGKRLISANSAITTDFNNSLKESKLVETLRNNAKEIEELKAENKAFSDTMGKAITKLNAILEVQESAYNASNLPKETQVTIRNLIAAGKFADNKAHVEVAQEVAALRSQMETLLKKAADSEKKVRKLTNTETPEAAAGVRYD